MVQVLESIWYLQSLLVRVVVQVLPLMGVCMLVVMVFPVSGGITHCRGRMMKSGSINRKWLVIAENQAVLRPLSPERVLLRIIFA
ncbi:Uncharacterised protein [Yersinia enterocolitica]|nr:Uncharacterised protein [Yersinia enterocolitica]